MRVALFTETFLPKIDGIVTVTCLLLDHLEKRGIESIIVAPKMGCEQYGSTRVLGVPGITMPLYPELKFGPPTYSTYAQVRDFRPDVIHTIGPALIGGAGLAIAKWLGVPTVASFHLDLSRLVHHFNIGFMEPVTDFWTRLIYNQADFALAPSKQVQRQMLDIGVRQVGLWRRGVDAEKFNPRFRDNVMRARLTGGHPDDTVLIYVGRLSAEKRIGDLKAALEQVPGTCLALVGDGPARADLEEHFAGTNAIFMGYLQGEELAKAYASADVFVFPSAMESFGLVVVEAMAAGLPVVASRVGGIPDVVESGRTGYTFNVGDIAEMVAGVRQLVASRENIRQMGQAARAFAETQSWPAMMDEVVELYARLIDTRRQRAA